MAAEYARSIGAAAKAAARLADTQGRIERTRRKLERLEQVAARRASLQEAALARAAVMADGLRLATPDADPTTIAAVRGWKEMHERGWMSKRLCERLQQAQPEYVSGTDLANWLADEAGLPEKPGYEAMRWRDCVRWSLKHLRNRGVVESVARLRVPDSH